MPIAATLGFIYTPDFSEVLLITKRKPEHHKGMLNGLGGKCDPGEDFLTCMVREVKEEAGIHISPEEWKEMGALNWRDWEVEIFAAVYTGDKSAIQSLTLDEVAWYKVNALPKNVLTNLCWLIPMGCDVLNNVLPPRIEVRYT